MSINDITKTNIEEKIYKFNILNFAFGRLISGLGSSIFRFALSLYILDITGSAVYFSIVMGFSILPGVLVNIFAGVFVDKHNKKRIIVTCDILSGIVLLLFIMIFKINSTNMVLFVINSVILSIIQAYFSLALNASIPDIVKKEDVTKVNSIHQSLGAIINIIGPILGALAYNVFGLELVLIIDGISFIFSGLLEVFLRFNKSNIEKPQISYMEGVKDVFKYLNSEAEIKYLLFIFLVINFVYTPVILVVLPYSIYTKIQLSAYQFGLIEASWFVGIISGALLVSIKKVNSYVIDKIFIMVQLQATFLILWFLPKIFYSIGSGKWFLTFIFILLLGIMGICNSMFNIPMITYVQVFTPEKLRGRVFGVINSICSAAIPLGMWIYGIILEYVDWVIITSITGVIIVIIAIIANSKKSIKDFFTKKHDLQQQASDI